MMDRVATSRKNAFLVNTIGVNGTPFPFRVRTDVTPAGVWTLSLVALDVSDVGRSWADIALPNTYVWDIGHYQFRPGSDELLIDAEEIARTRAIEVTGYDIEWARAHRGPAREGIRDLIRIRSSDLPRFVEDLHTYDFQMIDASHDLSKAELDELMLIANTRGPQAAMLDRLAWASVYVSNHDACYMWQETRSNDLLRATVCRAVLNFTMASSHTDLEVLAPTPLVLDHLIEPGTAWTAPQDMVTVSEDAIRLAICRGDWKLGQNLPRDAAYGLQYRFKDGTWEWLPA
jgi:hypothetical protein